MELAQIPPSLSSGDVPQIVADTAHPTSPVYVLDLTGAWLRRQQPWGYVAAALMLVKSPTVGLGLLAANAFAVAGGGKTDGPLNVLWAAIAVGSAAMLRSFLHQVRDSATPWSGRKAGTCPTATENAGGLA